MSSSSTRVDAGSPRVSSGEVGTETTFIAVPNGVIRAGMKSALCATVGTVSLGGQTTAFGLRVNRAKTRPIRLTRSSVDAELSTLATSEAESTRRSDIVARGEVTSLVTCVVHTLSQAFSHCTVELGTLLKLIWHDIYTFGTYHASDHELLCQSFSASAPTRRPLSFHQPLLPAHDDCGRVNAFAVGALMTTRR